MWHTVDIHSGLATVIVIIIFISNIVINVTRGKILTEAHTLAATSTKTSV